MIFFYQKMYHSNFVEIKTVIIKNSFIGGLLTSKILALFSIFPTEIAEIEILRYKLF